MSTQQALATDDLYLLVLLYLSVAYESDHDFDPAEHHAILGLLRRWMPDLAKSETGRIVDTAYNAVRSGMGPDLESLARSLGAKLSASRRRRVLTDLGQIARADGFLSVEEASIIRRVRASLGPEPKRPTEEPEKEP